MENNMILEHEGKTLILFAQHKDMLEYMDKQNEWFDNVDVVRGCFVKDYNLADKDTILEIIEKNITAAGERNFCVLVINRLKSQSSIFKPKMKKIRFMKDGVYFIVLDFMQDLVSNEEALLSKIEERWVCTNNNFRYNITKKEGKDYELRKFGECKLNLQEEWDYIEEDDVKSKDLIGFMIGEGYYNIITSHEHNIHQILSSPLNEDFFKLNPFKSKENNKRIIISNLIFYADLCDKPYDTMKIIRAV